MADSKGETEQRPDGPTATLQTFTHPYPPAPQAALVPYFSRNVVAVDGFLLQEHVKTAFVLGEWVTCNPACTQKYTVERRSVGCPRWTGTQSIRTLTC